MRQANRGMNFDARGDPGANEKAQRRYEIILNMIEDADLVRFGRFIESLKKENMPPETIKRWEHSFQEYALTRRELLRELGGHYSFQALREKIPENLCIKRAEEINQVSIAFQQS